MLRMLRSVEDSERGGDSAGYLGNPVLERVLQCLVDRANLDAGGEKLPGVKDAVGTGRFGGSLVEFGVVAPVLKGAIWSHILPD